MQFAQPGDARAMEVNSFRRSIIHCFEDRFGFIYCDSLLRLLSIVIGRFLHKHFDSLFAIAATMRIISTFESSRACDNSNRFQWTNLYQDTRTTAQLTH